MATYKTKAIILSSYPYKEHDRIITFFSEDYGRMEARARGTRKIVSKLAGHLEPFIITELLLAQGKHWDILAGSRTILSQGQVRGNIEILALASLCVEAVKLITRPLAADKRVFSLLQQTLLFLENPAANQSEKQAASERFLWQLLALSGFSPELDQCIQCHADVAAGYFSFEGGGVLCVTCARHDLLAVSIDTDALLYLRANIPVTSPAISKIVIGFWRRVVDHVELRSWNFWETIVHC